MLTGTISSLLRERRPAYQLHSLQSEGPTSLDYYFFFFTELVRVLQPMKYSQKGQNLPSGPLGWLNWPRQDQSSTEKYLNPKRLPFYDRCDTLRFRRACQGYEESKTQKRIWTFFIYLFIYFLAFSITNSKKQFRILTQVC